MPTKEILTSQFRVDLVPFHSLVCVIEIQYLFHLQSGEFSLPHHALHHRLKHALPDRIKDSLTLGQEPPLFGDWKRLVLSIDQRYWEYEADICWDTQPDQG